MLIDAVIRAGLDSSILRAARPVAAWAPEKRRFLMCRPLFEAIEKGRIDDDDGVRRRWAQLEADIGSFVEGGLITEKLVKQLMDRRYEHWEVISRRPKPSLRVFARFAKPDVLIGTHVMERRGLGGMWASEFEHEKLVCEDHWKAAGLPTQPPPGAFTAAPCFAYESYITDNAQRRLEVLK